MIYDTANVCQPEPTHFTSFVLFVLFVLCVQTESINLFGKGEILEIFGSLVATAVSDK